MTAEGTYAALGKVVLKLRRKEAYKSSPRLGEPSAAWQVSTEVQQQGRMTPQQQELMQRKALGSAAMTAPMSIQYVTCVAAARMSLGLRMIHHFMKIGKAAQRAQLSYGRDGSQDHH